MSDVVDVEEACRKALDEVLAPYENEGFKAAVQAGFGKATSVLLPIISNLKKDSAEKEKEIRKMKPVRTIRKKIEIYEGLLAPELKDPKSVFNHAVIKSTNQLMDFHEAKWRVIISKTGDIRVDRLNGLIAAANIPPTVFCRTMGSFFLIASGGIHLPNLSSYTKNEMECILRDEFEINDTTTISCVTDVLMEV